MIPTQASPRGSSCPYRVGASVHRPDANWPGLLQPGCPVPSWTQDRESVLHAQGLCASEGVVRISTRDARVCGNVVVCWREIPARLPSPLSPQHPFQTSAWRGRSLNGWPGGRLTPTFQSNWRQTGGGGDAREPLAY